MAPFAFTSATIYVGAYDLTCDLNKVDGSYNPNFLDVTTFCSQGWRQRIAGLNDVDFSMEGFNDFSSAAANSSSLYPLLGTTNVVTVTPNSTATAGDAAYLFRSLSVSRSEDAQIGEAAKFTGTYKGQSQMAGGFVALPRASRAASGSSSVVQAGTASNGQVFATRHVFVAGTTLASWIESATNVSMLGAVTRATFTTASAVGGEWVSAAVAVTSGSFWRAQWVLTGTFDFAISFDVR